MRMLKTIMIASVIGLALTGAGVGIGIEVAQGAPAKPEERHPEIHRALTALHNAHKALEDAARDYKGHRAEAIKATNSAIQECETCLKIDP